MKKLHGPEFSNQLCTLHLPSAFLQIGILKIFFRVPYDLSIFFKHLEIMLKIDGIAPIIDNDGKDGRVHSLTLKSIFVISVQHLVSSLLQSPPPLPSPSPESQATQATLCQNLLSFSQSLDVLFSNHSPVVNTGQYTLYWDQYMWETRVKTTLLNLTTPNPRVNIQTKLLIGFGVSQ